MYFYFFIPFISIVKLANFLVVTILKKYYCPFWFHPFVGFAYQGKDIVVFRFTIEYSSSLRDFYRPILGNNNRSIFIWGFLKDDIFWLVLKLEICYNRVIISWKIFGFPLFFLGALVFKTMMGTVSSFGFLLEVFLKIMETLKP
jgi:hypothetical protein